MYRDLWNDAKDMRQTILRLRRALHQVPEVGLELPETMKIVGSELDRLGIPYETFGQSSSIAARLGSGEHCILLRADADGIPVKEDSGVSFASQNGCMHACGHDMHTAALLGAAALLKKREHLLGGGVTFLFQAGEETYDGASMALSDGILEFSGAEAAVAVQVMSQLPLNYILYGDSPMASMYEFKIRLWAKDGRETLDVMNAGVHIYLALQELAAQECRGLREVVLAVEEFAAANVKNGMPGTFVLKGSLKAFGERMRGQLIERIEKTVHQMAAVYGTEATIEKLADVPALSCSRRMNEEIARGIRQINPSFNVWDKFHTMNPEDFAFIAQRVPSSYFAVGAAPETCGDASGEHEAGERFHEDALPIAAAVYACAAQSWLEKRRKTAESARF